MIAAKPVRKPWLLVLAVVSLCAAGVAVGDPMSEGRDLTSEIRATEARIAKLSNDASRKKDMVKINCLADKLSKVRGHIALAGPTLVALQTANDRGDAGARQHELTRLTILSQKVAVLNTEAENCIGDDASYVGKTTVDVDIDPQIPEEDPTKGPLDTVPVNFRPPAASPFI